MLGWLYAGVVTTGFAGYWMFVSMKNSKAISAQRGVFQGRERSEIEPWFVRYFVNTGLPAEELVSILQPIAEAMQCDVTQLRPDDSFTGTLAFKGVVFLGIDDDNPLTDYGEHDLPRLLGSKERASVVVDKLHDDPTLHTLARAIADTQ